MKYPKLITIATAVFLSGGIVTAYAIQTALPKESVCTEESCCRTSAFEIERYQADRDRQAIEALFAKSLLAKDSATAANFTMEKLAFYVNGIVQTYTEPPLEEINKIEDEKMRKVALERMSLVVDKDHPMIIAYETHVLRSANKTVGFICSSVCTINKPQTVVMQGIAIMCVEQEEHAQLLINQVLKRGAECNALMITVAIHKDDATQAKAFEHCGFMKAGINGSCCAYIKQLKEIAPAVEEAPVKNSCVIHVSKENFEQVITNAKLPVVLDIYATWCSPCKALSPLIEKLAQEYQGKYTFAKLNADENPELLKHYGVTGIPMLIFIKDNTIKGTSVGLVTKELIKEKLEQLFN